METVHIVWGYYDAPKAEIADYRGQPHYFSCQFDQDEDEYGNVYDLTLIDTDTMALALEQWSIWRKWALVFMAGQVLAESHPSNDGSNSRYAELERILQSRLDALPQATIFAHAEFHPKTVGATEAATVQPLFVEWSNAD